MVVLPFVCIFFLLNFHGNFAMKTELSGTSNTIKLQTYIVHVKQPEPEILGDTIDLQSWYTSFLPETIQTLNEKSRLLYSYRNVMSGFSARLTEEEVKAMEEKEGFISATPETILNLHTTHTPEYLGLNQQFGLWKDSNFGKGVIIGVLDTGINPYHPSFNDDGMPQPPAKWKGRCEFGASICNKKLIGARTFNRANSVLMGESPIDENGHGTHAASTAAGTIIEGAEAFGNARGKAAGMAPLAHLAMYKVCSSKGLCPSSDILAGLDAAVEDGVDVLSLSLGVPSISFFNSYVAIGSFAAIRKGIFVSCSAGNSGPFKSTLSNDAPWILTVGASTIDRTIVALAKLGNGEVHIGESLFQPRDFLSTFLPLVYAGNSGIKGSEFCVHGSLANLNVKGKVVVCETETGVNNSRVAKGLVVKNAGGAAMIVINQKPYGFTTIAEAHVLPATHVSYKAGLKIKAYISSSHKPIASISFKGTLIGNKATTFSPAMAYFSSRGPSLLSPGILKPDITGPGVNILAAWPFSIDNNTNTKSTFNIISGTSMSCPHLSGIAALIKSVRPNWSPAAIKSAIMTSADVTNPQGKPIMDQDLKPANFFAMGSGHVNPSKAVDPGLVYDIQIDDYIPYLCGLYSDVQVSIIVRRQVRCSKTSRIREGDLNYPSFAVTLGASQMFNRTVTNVGDANSVYSAIVKAPVGVSVRVTPSYLKFSRVNEKVTYSVTFSRDALVRTTRKLNEGYLIWVSDKHSVRSPISVKFKKI